MDVEQGKRNEQLLSDMCGLIAGLGQQPVILGGDLNVRLERSLVLQSHCRDGLLTDFAVLQATLEGGQPEPTCFVRRSSSVGSRIDYILGNATAALCFRKFWVDREGSCPMHDAVVAEVAVEHCKQEGRRLRRPAGAFTFQRLKDEEEERELATKHSQPILHDYAAAWEDSMQWANPDLAFEVISSASEEYLSSRSRGHRYLLPHEKGRGSVRFQKYSTCAPAQSETDAGAGTVRCVRLKKLLRRTEELTKKCFLRGLVALSTEPDARELAANIEHDVRALVPELHCNLGTTAGLGELCRAIRTEVCCEQATLIEQRKGQWAQATRVDWQCNRKEIFNLVKDKTPGNLSILKRADGSYTSKLSELDTMLRTEWLPVFRKYEEEPEPSWEAFYARFGQHIPNSPMPERQPLTPGRLRHTLKKMSASTSIGGDSWSVSELRLLSDELLQMFCDLCAHRANWLVARSLVLGHHLTHPQRRGTAFHCGQHQAHNSHVHGLPLVGCHTHGGAYCLAGDLALSQRGIISPRDGLRRFVAS